MAQPAARADRADRPQGTPRSARILGGIVIIVAALYPLMFVAVALLRLPFPFELEWMEGGTLDHVRRILSGQPLYVPPSIHFVPFIYPPLYFYVAAGSAKLLGAGFIPLRLVSIVASLASLLLIYRIVRRDGGSPGPALLAACLFAASYRQGGAWLDVARVDALFLGFLLASFFVLRRETAPFRSGLLGGALLILAFFTKQATIFVIPFLLVAMAITDWRRLLGCSLALVLLGGGGVLWLDRITGGWFRYYVFELPRHHPIIGQLLRGFWTSSLLAPFGVALTLGTFHFFAPDRWQRPRLLALDLGFTLGMILCAYLTKIRVGSFDNVVLPAYAAGSVVFGFGLNALSEARSQLPERLRFSLERLVAFLCLVQFLVLAYKPWNQLPTKEDLAAGNQCVASIGRWPGDAWIPAHGYLAELAGKPGYAHQLALVDVLRPAQSPERRHLLEELRTAFREHQFSIVVLDENGWVQGELEPYYRLYARMFAPNEPGLFWPVTGYVTRPDFVWIPRTATR